MSNNTEKVSIVMHPKVFAAFGADLVTNDVVALIELVKIHMMHLRKCFGESKTSFPEQAVFSIFVK